MSYLYVNGCSYTYGHPTEENQHTIKQQRPTWTWSDHLSQHYDHMVNEAWFGGSNHRIFRRTLEFFEGRDSKDWTAVIQWTNPDRYEYYDSEHDTHVGVLVDQLVLDDRSWNKFINNSVLKNNFNVALAYQTLIGSNQRLEEYWMMSCALAQYFQRRGIKFLFTTMSANGHPRYTNLGAFQHCVDISQYTEKSVSRLLTDKLRENPPTDNHPNKNGHVEIYKYILNELRQRQHL
jgi:hypothetical protein